MNSETRTLKYRYSHECEKPYTNRYIHYLTAILVALTNQYYENRLTFT